MNKQPLKLLYDKSHQSFEAPTGSESWILKENLGFSPIENLINSIAACCGYVYDSVLNHSAVSHQFKKIEVSYKQAEAKRSHPIQQVELVFYLQVEKRLQAKALRCLRLVLPNCPVVQSLNSNIEIKERVHFI